MATPLITGRAVIIGSTGDITMAGAATNVDQEVIGVSVGEEADVERVMTGRNEVNALAVTNVRRTLTINFYPIADTVSNTTATALTAGKLPTESSSSVLPAIPSKVTLNNFKEGYTDYIDGSWVYEGGGTIQYDQGVAQMTLPLVRYTSSAMTTDSLTTSVA